MEHPWMFWTLLTLLVITALSLVVVIGLLMELSDSLTQLRGEVRTLERGKEKPFKGYGWEDLAAAKLRALDIAPGKPQGLPSLTGKA